MRKIITLKQLKEMKPGTIFASGIGLIEHPWFNDAKHFLEPDGKSTKVKWVAIRGGIEDWAIYHSMDANICMEEFFDCDCHLTASNEVIARSGAKLHNREIIRKFVPCNNEALDMYRN